MIPIKRALSVALVSAIAACSQAPLPAPLQGGPVLSSTNTQLQGATVEVRIETGTQLKTLAAKKTIADVDHYHIKLINTATNVVVAEGDSTDLVSFFHKMPNGTYKVNVDALDATGASIVQGGAQDSSNTVTVAAPNVTYSDGGPCLKVRLKLLNATGEKVGNNIVVEDGDEWTGMPELQAGGNCPCPTPNPTPTATPTPGPSSGTILGTFSVGTMPWDIAIDSSGNAWTSNFGSQNVTKLSPTENVLGTYAVAAHPWSIAIDRNDNVWTTNNNATTKITKLSPGGDLLENIAIADEYPRSIAIDAGNIIWASLWSGGIRKLSQNGDIIGSYSLSAVGIAIDQAGNAWTTGYNTLTKLSPTGIVLGNYAVSGEFADITIDGSDNVWLVNTLANNVTKVSPTGTVLGTYNVGFRPLGMAIDRNGDAWVANSGDNTVTKLSSAGNVLNTFAVGQGPRSIATDSTSAWVVNTDSNNVTRLAL
jgi:streptogramin lyase